MYWLLWQSVGEAPTTETKLIETVCTVHCHHPPPSPHHAHVNQIANDCATPAATTTTPTTTRAVEWKWSTGRRFGGKFNSVNPFEFNIYSRQSSPPPSSHRLQCSGSQESFAAEQYCGHGGGGGGWSSGPLPTCGGPHCHHGGPPPPPPPLLGNGGIGGLLTSLGPSTSSSFHGPPPQLPPPACNPCTSATNSNSFNSVPLSGPSRWGPRTSCPVHSPFRARMPNGSVVCSGHQVNIWNNGCMWVFFFFFRQPRVKIKSMLSRSISHSQQSLCMAWGSTEIHGTCFLVAAKFCTFDKLAAYCWIRSDGKLGPAKSKRGREFGTTGKYYVLDLLLALSGR